MAKQDQLGIGAVFDAYPGGMSALARAAGVSYWAIRRLRNGQHERIPWDLLRAVWEVDWSAVPFAPQRGSDDVHVWLALWRSAARKARGKQ